MNTVYSNNEWSPLKEVILGSPLNYQLPSFDMSFKLFFQKNIQEVYARVDNKNKPQVKPIYLKELQEDIEEMQKVLENMGIIVHRPKILKQIAHYKTPYFSATGLPALNVRDQVVILKNRIVELAPQVRCRYFENDLLKPIFYEFFKRGNCNWFEMPKPMMLDSSFDKTSLSETYPIENTDIHPNIELNFGVGHEMMIDAAQLVRFGKDIIVNVSTNNHRLGAEWLIRMFPEYNFHILRSVTDNHLDSFIVPLCEGTVLIRNDFVKSILPDFLKNWKIIKAPAPRDNQYPKYGFDDIRLAGKFVDINVLSLDGKRIMCNSLFPELVDLLEKEGFDPVPVQHRHRRLFNGGFHCFTLDIVREC